MATQNQLIEEIIKLLKNKTLVYIEGKTLHIGKDKIDIPNKGNTIINKNNHQFR